MKKETTLCDCCNDELRPEDKQITKSSIRVVNAASGIWNLPDICLRCADSLYSIVDKFVKNKHTK